MNPVKTKPELLKTIKLFWGACNKVFWGYFVSKFNFVLEAIKDEKIYLKNLIVLHAASIYYYMVFAQFLKMFLMIFKKK